jgi:DeoR family transcriptional regulator, catabolite repression regulator
MGAVALAISVVRKTEELVLKSNDFSEQPIIRARGVLPMRRPPKYPDLRLGDPALHGMTDFTHKVPISVAPERPIDEALADMRRFGVRALLVISGDSIVGFITSYDIEGPRPQRFSQYSNIKRREYIRVVDIMTEWDDMPTVDWSTMQSARVADLLEIFYGIGVMHLLVIEGEEGGGIPVVRGLVSRACIERRLAG